MAYVNIQHIVVDYQLNYIQPLAMELRLGYGWLVYPLQIYTVAHANSDAG